MLKQTETETEPISAAQVRVTPEELADAIATLQVRKEGQSVTIAIGDAVHELSLDATPPEILEAVQARREQRKWEQIIGRRQKRVAWFAVAAAAIDLVAMGIWQHTNMHSYSQPLTVTAASPQADNLSTIHDGQQIYVDTHGLEQIISGQAPTQVKVYKNSYGIRWGLIKHSGQVYVQAYTLQASEKQIESKTIELRNAEDSEISARQTGFILQQDGRLIPDVKVTLPVQAFHYEDSQQGTNQASITVSDVRPDDHLWDNFDRVR